MELYKSKAKFADNCFPTRYWVDCIHVSHNQKEKARNLR